MEVALNRAQSVYPIAEPADVGEARRGATALAGAMGFGETDRGRVALVVTELGTNIVKFAGRGEIVVGEAAAAPNVLEVLALDRGPGMADVERCRQDGYSSAGSPGTGLGAVQRMATGFEAYSGAGVGSALLARLDASGEATPRAGSHVALGAVCLAMPGESVCGDQWDWVEQGDRALVLVADGLGHGIFAHEAAREAARVFREHAHANGPEQLLERMHAALRSTRGAAGAVAELTLDAARLQYAGIGNISACVVTGATSRNLVSHNGTLGLEVRHVRGFEYVWSPRAVLVMHSDGLATHWDLAAYPGLLRCDPSLIAGVLYRDHARRRDDVTVVVLVQTERRS